MKQISIKLPPSDHQARGIGFYVQRLISAMQDLAPTHDLKINLFSHHPPANTDLIHYPYFDLFIPSLALFKSSPTIVSILDVIPLQYPTQYPPGIKGKVSLMSQKFALRNVDHILTISNFSKNQIEKLLDVKKEKITVTVLAADPLFKPQKSLSQLKEISQRYKLPNKFVLYVGDINWNKNIIRLTQASLNADLDLVIVGKSAKNEKVNFSHPELRHFKQWLDLYAPNPHVHRTGFVPSEDLVSIYNLATCYCQPSISEGFGLSLLEAMSCGTPCISSNRSSLPEVGGKAVLYFDPENVAEMTKSIKTVVNNKKLANKIRKQGIEQSKFFSWNQTAALTIDTYLKFL